MFVMTRNTAQHVKYKKREKKLNNTEENECRSIKKKERKNRDTSFYLFSNCIETFDLNVFVRNSYKNNIDYILRMIQREPKEHNSFMNGSIDVYFKEKENPSYYCSKDLPQYLSTKPVTYQIIFKNLCSDDFNPRITLLEKTNDSIKELDCFLCYGGKKVRVSDYYRVDDNVKEEYGWGNKLIEFQLLECKEKEVLFFVCDQDENVFYFSKIKRILKKKSEKEKIFWRAKLESAEINWTIEREMNIFSEENFT